MKTSQNSIIIINITMIRNPSINSLQPERIQKDVVPWIQDFCVKVEAHIVDNKPGIPKEEIAHLRQTLNDYQKVLDVKMDKIKLSEARLQEIRERGIDIDNISEETCSGTMLLLRALVSLAEYLERVEELNRSNAAMRGEENIKLGAQANIRFLNFFLKIQKQHDLNLSELTDVYTQIFYKTSLAYELKLVDIQNFPPGILAAVRAFWYLKHNDHQESEFHVPSVEEDMYHGVDLICEKKDESGKITEQSLFQIKGRNKGGEASVFDVSNSLQVTELEKKLREQNLPDWDLEHHLRVLRQLIKYQNELQKKSAYPVKAYWVEVLMEY